MTASRATQAWWDSLEEVDAAQDPDALFTATSTIRPVLDTIEGTALPVIAENLAALLQQHPSFRVVDHAARVFGDYYGQVRDNIVRDAVKLLHRQGRTASTGIGGRPRDLVVARP